VCFAAHAWSFLDGLPYLSNFACLPGRAGGTPISLVRYNSNGSVDTTFNLGGGIGTGGGIITGFGSSFPAGSAFALAIQSNGEIVVAGQAFPSMDKARGV
jgi:hypothetical protein